MLTFLMKNGKMKLSRESLFARKIRILVEVEVGVSKWSNFQPEIR